MGFECPWCGGKTETALEWGASLAFSTGDDVYETCTECSWNEYKVNEFDIRDR